MDTRWASPSLASGRLLFGHAHQRRNSARNGRFHGCSACTLAAHCQRCNSGHHPAQLQRCTPPAGTHPFAGFVAGTPRFTGAAAWLHHGKHGSLPHKCWNTLGYPHALAVQTPQPGQLLHLHTRSCCLAWLICWTPALPLGCATRWHSLVKHLNPLAASGTQSLVVGCLHPPGIPPQHGANPCRSRQPCAAAARVLESKLCGRPAPPTCAARHHPRTQGTGAAGRNRGCARHARTTQWAGCGCHRHMDARGAARAAPSARTDRHAGASHLRFTPSTGRFTGPQGAQA